MEKVSVTLEAEVVAAIREHVGKREFSAFVNETLKRRLKREQLRAYLDELDRIHGPVPDDVRERVDAEPWPF